MSTKPARLNFEELTKFTTELLGGLIFTSTQVPDRLLSNVFMPLIFGALRDWTEEEVSQIGIIWEYLSAAGPLSVNGQPMFLSCRIMHRDDWKIVREMCEKANEASKIAMSSVLSTAER